MSAAHSVPQFHRPGRPPLCPREIVIRVVELRRQGLSYSAISAMLNHEGLPTPGGRPVWRKSYVDRLLHTQYAREIWQERQLLSGGDTTGSDIALEEQGCAAVTSLPVRKSEVEIATPHGAKHALN